MTGCRLIVIFNGMTIELPRPDKITVAHLYERWLAEGDQTFEVRDISGKLLAVGLRVRKTQPLSDD